jgi:hypothetical protein
MSDESPVYQALRPLIAAARTPAQCRALAAELESIALIVRNYAEAARREQQRPPGKRLRPATRGGGRPGAMTVYLQIRNDRHRSEPMYTLRIGRGVYNAYQALRPDPAAPLRLAPQVVGDTLRLVATPDGYLVTVNDGGVRVNVSGARDELAALVSEVRWPAEAQAGAIVVRLR